MSCSRGGEVIDMQINKRPVSGLILFVPMLLFIVVVFAVIVLRDGRWDCWTGRTDVEAEFVVTDAATGMPVPGATIQIQKSPREYDEKKGDFTLVTDAAGRAKRFFKECTCTGTEGPLIDRYKLRIPLMWTDTYRVTVPWNWQVKAPGYAPGDFFEAAGGSIDEDNRGPPFTKLTINVSLQKEP
jgi:hypothetical protein